MCTRRRRESTLARISLASSSKYCEERYVKYTCKGSRSVSKTGISIIANNNDRFVIWLNRSKEKYNRGVTRWDKLQISIILNMLRVVIETNSCRIDNIIIHICIYIKLDDNREKFKLVRVKKTTRFRRTMMPDVVEEQWVVIVKRCDDAWMIRWSDVSRWHGWW